MAPWFWSKKIRPNIIPGGFTDKEALVSAVKAISDKDFRLFWDVSLMKYYGGFESVAIIRAARPEEEGALKELFAQSRGDIAFDRYTGFWIRDGGTYFLARKINVLPKQNAIFAKIEPFPVRGFANYSEMCIAEEPPSSVTQEGSMLYRKIIKYLKQHCETEHVTYIKAEFENYEKERQHTDLRNTPHATHAPEKWTGYMIYSTTYMNAYNSAITSHLLFSSPLLQECTGTEGIEHNMWTRQEE